MVAVRFNQLHCVPESWSLSSKPPQELFPILYPGANLTRTNSMANTIDKTAVDAARDRIKARLARVRAVDEGRADDMASDLNDDGVAIDGSVVVARGVTQAAIDAIPPAWLGGDTILDLTADGVLIMKAAEGYQHAAGSARLTSLVGTYADANRMMYGSGAVALPTLGATMYPDTVLRCRNGDNAKDRFAPLVIFELEVTHRSFKELIGLAITYLDELPSVQRVVCIKVFPECDCPLEDQLFQLPAVVAVFERYEDKIRVAQMQSFGNGEINHEAIKALIRPENGARLEPYPEAFLHCGGAPQLPPVVRLAGFFDELDALWDDEAIEMPCEIDMPGSYKSIALDLKKLFVTVAEGWARDQRTATGPIRIAIS